MTFSRIQPKVLDSTRYVVEKADLVKINTSQVACAAEVLYPTTSTHWINYSPFDTSSFTDEEKLNFFFLSAALCFSFWGEPKWKVSYRGEEHDGTWALVAALGRGSEENVLNFSKISTIDERQAAELLRGTVEIPLYQERVSILREVSEILEREFEGQVAHLVRQAEGDATLLLELIVNYFPSFRDESNYRGQKVYFYKRAQLFIGDVHRAFSPYSYGGLQNFADITAFADYKLPQTLRKLGILEYHPSLEKRIDAMDEIAKGTEEEIELRAATIWSVELLKEEMRKKLPFITPIEVADILWIQSQKKGSADKPYHRTRTIHY